jgi:hypothetical protein
MGRPRHRVYGVDGLLRRWGGQRYGLVTNGGRQPFGSRSAQVTITERKRRRLAPDKVLHQRGGPSVLALFCFPRVCNFQPDREEKT